jgi:chemotaxis protein CheC
MLDPRNLQERQLDALREVANIGAGHAATALSQMTERPVYITVPEVRIVRLEEIGEALGDPEEVVAGVLIRMLGDATGRSVQIFPRPTAERLTRILLRRADVDFPTDFHELEQSMLSEVSNIMVGAYLNALSDFMGMLLIMSVPDVTIDMAAAVLATGYTNFGEVDDYVFLMGTRMVLDGVDEPLRADFLLIPDTSSLDVILRSLRLA